LEGLNASGLKLLSYRPARLDDLSNHAVVFASNDGLNKFEKKIQQFESENKKKKKDGSGGGPKNADLVQGIQAITGAALRSLWRSGESRFPDANATVQWEVWLQPDLEISFRAAALQAGIHIGIDCIKFPDDTVVVATCNQAQLAQLVLGRGEVKALAVLATLPAFFDDLPAKDQSDWVKNLEAKTEWKFSDDPTYVTLLDTGVSRSHPLISPVIDAGDRHVAVPGWSLEDNSGHGTQMAGLAVYGDLNIALQSVLPIQIEHRLESAKIIPDAGYNQHHLLGKITEQGIEFAETGGARRRVFSLATTTSEDTPHDGAPTSWSAATDQTCFGNSDDHKRLLVVSAGNSVQSNFVIANYLQISDSALNEIESPAQAWNAIAVGAFTEKATVTDGSPGVAYAPVGDLSPSSRTASWSTTWPLKPDVVLEGGNWWHSGVFPPMKHGDLELLTTHHTFPNRAFCTAGQTSAATAVVSGQLAKLRNAYPDLWPETIRAIYVASARWTNQMLSHLPANPSKGSFDKLFRRYGYGIPDLPRALKSASNSLALIVQDKIVPYAKSNKKGAKNIVYNELKLFELPWPQSALSQLGNTQVTLRVALSTFIEPNPAEASRGGKYLYASHNLRFKLNRANESSAQFLSRISAETVQEENQQPVDDSPDGWRFGVNRRDVGSLHIDELTCLASDLARRNVIAVHPVAGWWKSDKVSGVKAREVRFALVVEINAESVETDLYTEIENKIALVIEVTI
jgi:Subtilase family